MRAFGPWVGWMAGWGLIAAVAVLAIGAIVAAYVLAGRGTPEAAQSNTTPSSQAPEPSGTPSATAVSAADTQARMDAFITSYISTVTSDPRAAFDQLTPGFQQASGGYPGYIDWWSKVRSAELASITSDPSDFTVGYTINYVMKTGATNTQRVRLQLKPLADGYLISGEG